MGSVVVDPVCVTLAGKVKTVTAARAQTRACPASVCCAAAGATVSVGLASALSLEPTELPVKNAPPAQTPARSKSELRFSSQREWIKDVVKESPSAMQTLFHQSIPAFRIDQKQLPHTVVPYAAEKSLFSLRTKPKVHFDGLFGFFFASICH